jgi:hypothetical protein
MEVVVDGSQNEIATELIDLKDGLLFNLSFFLFLGFRQAGKIWRLCVK